MPIVEKKEIKISWDGRDETVVIKKMSYGEKETLREESADIRMVGNVMQTIIKPARFAFLAIMKSVELAPWKVKDIQVIQDLPAEIGEFIYDEVDKFNKLSPEKKDN
jgi:hypothetical protein